VPPGTPIIPVVRDDDGDGMPDITGAPECTPACAPTGPTEGETPDPADPTNPDPDGDGNTVPVAVAAVVDWIAELRGPGSVLEGESAAFTIGVRGRSDVAIVLGWAVAHGGTVAGDFTGATSGSVEFPAGGARSATITLAISDEDEDGEDDEAFSVALTVTRVGGATTTAELSRVRRPADVRTVISEYDPDEVNVVLLPEVMRALAGRQFQAISDRVSLLQGGGGTGRLNGAASGRFGGHSDWEDLIARRAQEMDDDDDNIDMKAFLGNSEFVLPIGGGGGFGVGGGAGAGVGAGGGAGAGGGFALWGDGYYGGLAGKSSGISWDGNLLSVALGLDARVQGGLVSGAMLQWNDADLEYTDANGVKGDYLLEMTGLHPYLGWEALGGRLQMWASAGWASGDLEITRAGAKSASDISMTSAGMGAIGPLLRRDGLDVVLRAEAFAARADVDGGDASEGRRALSESAADVNRVRVVVESKFARKLPSGATLTPSAEAGARFDGGDGNTGGGVELGAGVQYADAARGLEAGLRARGLASHTDTAAEDWGVSASVKLAPGADGQGVSFSLAPTYGNAGAARTQAMWSEGLVAAAADDGASSTADADLKAGMEIRAGYGLRAFTNTGLLTPFTVMTFTEDTRQYRLGVEWQNATGLGLELSGQRNTTDNTAPTDTFTLKGEMKF